MRPLRAPLVEGGNEVNRSIDIAHPPWCDPSYCCAPSGGWHRSAPVKLPLAIPQTGELVLSLAGVQRDGMEPFVLLEVYSPEPDGTPDPEPVAVVPVVLDDARRFASSLLSHTDTAGRAPACV
jgi:hypothetical protein